MQNSIITPLDSSLTVERALAIRRDIEERPQECKEPQFRKSSR